MRLLRCSACFCHLASILLCASFCILSESDDFLQDIHPWLDLQFRPIFILECRCTFQTSESLLDLVQKWSTRTSTFQSKPHFLPYFTEIAHYILSVPVRKLEFHASFSWENSTRTGFWIKLLNIISLTLSNPFIDVEYLLVRLCSGKKCGM